MTNDLGWDLAFLTKRAIPMFRDILKQSPCFRDRPVRNSRFAAHRTPTRALQGGRRGGLVVGAPAFGGQT